MGSIKRLFSSLPHNTFEVFLNGRKFGLKTLYFAFSNFPGLWPLDYNALVYVSSWNYWKDFTPKLKNYLNFWFFFCTFYVEKLEIVYHYLKYSILKKFVLRVTKWGKACMPFQTDPNGGLLALLGFCTWMRIFSCIPFTVKNGN